MLLGGLEVGYTSLPNLTSNKRLSVSGQTLLTSGMGTDKRTKGVRIVNSFILKIHFLHFRDSGLERGVFSLRGL